MSENPHFYKGDVNARTDAIEEHIGELRESATGRTDDLLAEVLEHVDGIEDDVDELVEMAK